MALYSYIGLDAAGAEQKGQLEAEDTRDVARILRERSIFLLKVAEGGSTGLEGGLGAKIRQAGHLLRPGRFLPVRSGDLVVFYRQIAMMLRAGFTLVAALEASHDMQVKHRMQRAIQRIGDEIRQGASFSASLAREKKIFSPMATNLIASGEQSGNLEPILERLAENLERSKDLRRQLLSAMFYPTLVLLAALFVVGVLVVYVIPRFAAFLAMRHAVLPRSTQILMDVSDWALRWGAPIGITLGIVIFLILAAYTTRSGKRIVDRWILALPLIGKAVLFAAMAQAGWNLSILLKSGITALESLRITGSVIGNLAVGDCFNNAAEGLLAGRALSKTFQQPHVPLMMQHMAAVGENSGQLDTVMHDVGVYYQKELAAKVKLMSVMVEPVMILMVGGLVFYVYLAVFQAVMSVSKGGM